STKCGEWGASSGGKTLAIAPDPGDNNETDQSVRSNHRPASYRWRAFYAALFLFRWTTVGLLSAPGLWDVRAGRTTAGQAGHRSGQLRGPKAGHRLRGFLWQDGIPQDGGDPRPGHRLSRSTPLRGWPGCQEGSAPVRNRSPSFAGHLEPDDRQPA